MFLREFHSKKIKENFLKLIAIIYSDDQNRDILLKYIIDESGLCIELDDFYDEIEDILAFKDDESEFEAEIMELLGNVDFKFYIEFLMISFNNYTPLVLKIKNLLEEKLNLDENIINLCKTWTINTSAHARNVGIVIKK